MRAASNASPVLLVPRPCANVRESPIHSKCGAQHFEHGARFPDLQWIETCAWKKENMLTGMSAVAENNRSSMDPIIYNMIADFTREAQLWPCQPQKKEFWNYIGLYVHPKTKNKVGNTHMVISDLYCGVQTKPLYILQNHEDCKAVLDIFADYYHQPYTSLRWNPTTRSTFTPVWGPPMPDTYNCWFQNLRGMPSNVDYQPAGIPCSHQQGLLPGGSGDYYLVQPAAMTTPPPLNGHQPESEPPPSSARSTESRTTTGARRWGAPRARDGDEAAPPPPAGPPPRRQRLPPPPPPTTSPPPSHSSSSGSSA